MKQHTFLLLAGWLHFAILLASAMVPRGLNWKEDLAGLHPFLRSLFWVYGVFIVFIIISFGAVTLLHLEALIQGTPLARTVCGVIALFWLMRLTVQLFVFDARSFLTNWFYKTGYHALTFVFLYFVIVYGWTALAS